MMNIIDENDLRKLLLHTLEEHPEVNLTRVADIYIEQKIIKNMVYEEGIPESDARRKGKEIYSTVEEVLIQEAYKLSEGREYDFNINSMIIKRIVMKEQLRILHGEEFKIQIRKEINRANPFWEQYTLATDILEKILLAAASNKSHTTEKTTQYNTLEFDNNILAFCGERGDGKSSAMMSFIHELEENKSHSLLFADMEYIKETDFVNTIYVDPTTLDHVHNVLDIILAQLFMRFKEKYNKEKWEGNKWSSDELIESFRRVYKILSVVKDSNTILQEEFDAAGSLAKLEKLSVSITLKEELSKLLQRYCSYMSGNTNNKKLIIAIDDLDLSLTHAYQMAEQIRKYLIIPEIVVIMAVRSDQLNLAVQEYNARQLQQLFLRDANGIIRAEIREMAIQYTSKLIPLAHRVILPKIQDWKGIEIIFVDQQKREHKISEEETVAISVLKMLYHKTGMVFLADEDGHSMLLPDNLRGVINFLVYLHSLKTPKRWDDYTTKEENIRSFLDVYYGTILPSFPALPRGTHIIKQIQNLVLRVTTASLHLDVANMLQELDKLYYATWTEEEKKDRHDDWLDMATDTSRGMNSLNFVIQGLNRLLLECSGYELRKQLYAICAFYTIKANLLLTHSRMFEQERYGFSSYTDSYIWGRLFSNLLPSINKSGKLIPRWCIPMPSARIFNCIADKVGLTFSYRLSDGDNARAKSFIDTDNNERKKFIFTWILMSFVSNGYVSLKKTPRYIEDKGQYINVPYVYANYSMQNYKHISLENYFVKPAILNTMYDKLNLRILGVSEEEFGNTVDIFYKYNEKLWKVSEILTANIDMILYLPRVVFGEYKGRAESAIKRTEELVYDVFEKICKLLKALDKDDEDAQSLSADDIRYIKFGQSDEERIDVANLYALLIEEAIAVLPQQSVHDSELEVKVQNLRDILDLRNLPKVPKVLDYSDGTNITTKWRNLREKVEQMAKSIAAYIYWSKDLAYISQNSKDSLCNFYYQILEQEKNNPEGLVTEEMRLMYNSFSNDYSSKNLKEKVAAIRSTDE